jgi:ribonuclease P protein component
MLARENRLVSADDFKSTMKQGRKVGSDHLVIYLKRDEAAPHARFGFVVAKSVGGAVKRNLVKRRLRAISRERLLPQAVAADVVVRALPGAAELEWTALQNEFQTSFDSAVKKTSKL